MIAEITIDSNVPKAVVVYVYHVAVLFSYAKFYFKISFFYHVYKNVSDNTVCLHVSPINMKLFSYYLEKHFLNPSDMFTCESVIQRKNKTCFISKCWTLNVKHVKQQTQLFIRRCVGQLKLFMSFRVVIFPFRMSGHRFGP